MAEKVKKSKTTAKPVAIMDAAATKTAAKTRKAAVKKESVPVAVAVGMPAREEIEQLARSYWASRGYQDGFAEQDWLRAEEELRKKAS